MPTLQLSADYTTTVQESIKTKNITQCTSIFMELIKISMSVGPILESCLALTKPLTIMAYVCVLQRNYTSGKKSFFFLLFFTKAR